MSMLDRLGSDRTIVAAGPTDPRLPRLDIEFDKAGAKKVVAKFITAAARAGDDIPF